jgi:hypothetical protein
MNNIENFKQALVNIQKNYGYDNNKEELNEYIIDKKDFDKLSLYEKKTLKNIGLLYGLLKDKNTVIDYNKFIKIIDDISKDKNDREKDYLIALFFPERIKHINAILDFPIPTYCYNQNSSCRITPNSHGNFLIQAICPILLDVESESSSIYINNHDDLDGIMKDDNLAHYKPLSFTRCIKGAFNAYILQAFKISVKYIGAIDYTSGLFGGSYFISTVSSLHADTNAYLFAYIDYSMNAVKVDCVDGLNVIYYPLDKSYNNFLIPNKDNIASNNMNTNLRLNIYGSGLPNNTYTNTVQFTFSSIYSVIPTQEFNELLPVEYYTFPNDHFNIIGSAQFIRDSKLSSYPTSKIGEIERMIELPNFIKKNALNDMKNIKNPNVNILDILNNIIGSNVLPEIKINKNMLLSEMDVDDNNNNNNNIEEDIE